MGTDETDIIHTGHGPPLQEQDETAGADASGALESDVPLEVEMDVLDGLLGGWEPFAEEEDVEVGEQDVLECEGEYAEYGEEEEDGDGDGEYTLRFEDGMDPLGFADIDASGLELYQQFQKLEDKAQAKKKRKAAVLRPCSDELPAAKTADVFGAEFDEILESMTRRRRRRSRKIKKKGRKKGSRSKMSPEVTRKLGDATLCYASGQYDQAIQLLEDVVRIAPNLPNTYHTLGLIYNAMGDKTKAMNFYMIAAHLAPKDPSLWKLLVAWSMEQGNTGLGKYCLSKAIIADPGDISLRLNRALLCVDVGDYQSAGDSYDQIIALFPSNVEAHLKAAKMYEHIGQVDKAVGILEKFFYENASEADLIDVVDLLASLHMRNKNHANALKVIKHAHSVYLGERELPLKISVKEGICEAYLGNMTEAETLFASLLKEPTKDKEDLVIEAADSLVSIGCHNAALNYYLMLRTEHENGPLCIKISQCYLSLKERANAIPFLYKALSYMESVDTRITLCSALLEEKRIDEAISVLSPPSTADVSNAGHSGEVQPWWCDGRIRVKLAKIYHERGMIKEFVDTLFSSVHDSLYVETLKKKASSRKRLKTRVLHERAKLLDDNSNTVFHGFKPIAPASELSKAQRAKKLLQQRAVLKEEMRAKALQFGVEWHSDDSEDESLTKVKKICEPSIPNLLNDEEQFQLIIDLCKALTHLRRNWESLDIMNYALKFATNAIPAEKKKELSSLGAHVACNAEDPKHGYEFVRSIVKNHPQSYAAWNCYYKVTSRIEGQLSRHGKILVKFRDKYVPPKVIYGHQCTRISQHQDATKAYLEALKMQPNHPLILLSVGTSLINLALGFRLKNKHLTVTQGLAFLYEYLKVCNNSQEAMYNVARAYHHVGLVTLAVKYYEKVLATKEKDFPIPKLPGEVGRSIEFRTAGYCDLHREAAYNLHLIYMKSGAVDLARQTLKMYCWT